MHSPSSKDRGLIVPQETKELSKKDSKKRLTLESLNIPIPGFQPRPKDKHQ